MGKKEAIEEFLQKEYLEDYTEILSIAVGITQYYPQQADSQVRNAMTHLARCVSLETNYMSEIRKAKGHLERGKRDCLKLAIIRKKEHIEDEIRSLRYTGAGLSEEIQLMRLEVISNHKEAYYQETIGSKDVSVLLESVLAQLIELEKKIIEIDNITFEPSLAVKRAYRAIAIGKKVTSLFGVAVIVFILGKYIVPFIANLLF